MLNVGSQTVPSLRRGGTDGESKRGAASERTPLSLCDTSPRRGWVQHRGPLSRRTGPYSWRLTLQRQGNPPLRDKGAPTQGTVGAVPRTGRAPTQELAFRYPTRYFCTTSCTSSCRRSFLFAFDVVYCLSEVDTWGAVYNEMYTKQDDSILEQGPGLNWSGYTDNYIREVIPSQSSRSGPRGVANQCFSTSSILHQPSCWARELCFDIGCGEDTLLFGLAWLHSGAVHRDGQFHDSIAVH